MINNPRVTAKEQRMIIGALKQIFSRSEYARSIREAARSKELGPKGGARYICESCKGLFAISDINVDHRQPVISIDSTGTERTIDELINNLWCDSSNLQILCIACHKAKTKQEKKQRAQYRRELKANNNG